MMPPGGDGQEEQSVGTWRSLGLAGLERQRHSSVHGSIKQRPGSIKSRCPRQRSRANLLSWGPWCVLMPPTQVSQFAQRGDKHH